MANTFPPAGRHNEDNAPQDTRSGLKILLAEDNIINQRLVSTLAEKQGHQIKTVANGRQAVDVSAAEPFDVILMDVSMPVMDGLEAARAIREREARSGGHVPIIALTALIRMEDIDRCLAHGMDDCIAKPFRASELMDRIGQTVPARRKISSAARDPVCEDASIIFDRREAMIRFDDNLELLVEMAGILLASLPTVLSKIRAAAESGDTENLVFAAHAFKGTAGNLSAKAASEAAYRLEKAARTGDAELIGETLKNFRLELERLGPVLQELRTTSYEAPSDGMQPNPESARIR